MRKRLLGLGLLLLAGLGVAFALPASRYQLLAFIRHERLYNGRPLAFWVAAMKDDDSSARRQAALILGEADVCTDRPAGDADCRLAITALVSGLADRDGFVRKCAATSFLLYPRETAVPTDVASITGLTGALRDQEAAVRKAAVRALWQAGKPAKEGDGVARLTVALTDKDDFVRMYAARALAKLGPDAQAAVPALIERLRLDEERDVRKLSGKALGLIGAKAIGPHLSEAAAALIEGLKGEPAEFREYSARALGQLGAKEALPALRQATKDSDESVRGAAEEALKVLTAP
jgi:HEAT repeat protein